MKKITIILAAAASVMLIGCSKEHFTEPESKQTTVLTVSLDETKTTIGELSGGKRSLYWANGDKICINGLVSAPLEGIETETKTASFTFSEKPSTPHNTFYPASYYKDANTVTLPAVAGSLPVPVADQGLSLKPVTGVLKITVNKGTNDANIVQVQVTATSQLSGDFTIDYAAGTLTGTDSSEEAKTVTLKKNEPLTADTPYEAFIPVPAGNYTFSVKVMDEAGNYMVKSTSDAKTVTAGKIMALEAFAFEPTGTEATTFEITTAEEFVAFAKKNNNGDFEKATWVIAKLMNDITFDETTSKALRDEGGIGVSIDSTKERYADHFFNSTFDGQGFSIKNYTCYETVKNIAGTADSIVVWTPLFNHAGSDSYIRNIVIDASCDYQIPKGYFGTLAYRVKGLVENVTCNANVTFQFIAGTTSFGGIVGKVYGGTVRNCTMNGQIVCNTTSGTTKVWKIGGVVGTVEEGGMVDNCKFTGYFQWGTASAGQGPSISTDYYFGGIAAHVINGKVLNSNVSTCSLLDSKGNPKTYDVRGKGGYPHIGGIAGCVEEGSLVSGCSNAQGWYVRLSSGFEAHIGGVVGTNNGTVTSCSYTAPATQSTTGNVGHNLLALGGVAGKNNGELISCTSTGCITGPTQYNTLTNAYIGGIAGWTTRGLYGLTNDGTVTTVTDTASRHWGSATGVIRAQGGVVGYVDGEITLDNLTNNGAVSYSMTTKLNKSGSIIGGVVGYINGPVTLSNSTNNGYVFNCNFNNSSAPIISTANLGGIVGVATGTPSKSAVISKCVNNKDLGCRRGMVGGICGWATRVNFTDCENYGGTEKGVLSGKETENIAHWQGGIVGKADTLAVINGCKVENIKLCYKPATATCVTGGIAGALLTSTSQIIGCTAKNVAIEPQTATEEKLELCVYGGVAGTSVEGSWIHSCKFSGTYGIKGSDPEPLTSFEICSDTSFDDDGNNELIEE